MQRMISLLVLLLLVLTGCDDNNSTFFIEESGTIETDNVLISTRTGGEIEVLLADEGDEVSKGDTLAILDTVIYRLQADQAKANFEAADAALDMLKNGARDEDKVQAEEALRQAEDNLATVSENKTRFENLYDQKAVTKKQLDEITNQYNIAKSRVKAAEANYKKIRNIARPEELKQANATYSKAEAAYNLALKNFRDCFIVSPVSGIVTARFAEPGETIAPVAPVFKISDLSEAELSVYIPETKLPHVKTGQDADISIDAYEDKIFKGKVTFISPEAEFTPKNIQTKDERTKLVFKVKITIPNPDYELKPGLPADAKIYIGEDHGTANN